MYHSQVVCKFLASSSVTSYLAHIKLCHNASWGHLPSILRSQSRDGFFLSMDTQLAAHLIYATMGERTVAQSQDHWAPWTTLKKVFFNPNKKPVIVIFLGMKKTFYAVSHRKLLMKLKSHCITVGWLDSQLVLPLGFR